MMRQGVDHVESACRSGIMIQVSSGQYFGTRLRIDLTGRMLDSDLIQAMIKHCCMLQRDHVIVSVIYLSA